MDAFPMTASGKVRKVELEAHVAAVLGPDLGLA